jgi:integral membrane protein (TIGR01906 family)
MTDMKSNFALQKPLSWIVTILVPGALVLSAVRAMMSPAFLNIEYNLPNFPADPYGFSTQDRLYWSRYALNYLLNDAGISYLGDLRFQNGQPVYNERELQHMVDVKATLNKALLFWYISLGALLVLGVWAWRGGWMRSYQHGLARGGWLTVLLVGTIIIFVLLSFGVFFVAFHDVFFQPGTWMFQYSDTLIRLFPERFWKDLFIYIGSLSALAGLVLAFAFRGRKRLA